MAAAANRNLQSPIPGESQHGEDVGRTGATGDEGGTSTDRPIPDRADLFVAFIERAEQRSGKARRSRCTSASMRWESVTMRMVTGNASPPLLPDATESLLRMYVDPCERICSRGWILGRSLM